MYRQLIDKQTDQISLIIIQRTTDKYFIPIDESNADYIDYLKWVAEGNTILPPEE